MDLQTAQPAGLQPSYGCATPGLHWLKSCLIKPVQHNLITVWTSEQIFYLEREKVLHTTKNVIYGNITHLTHHMMSFVSFSVIHLHLLPNFNSRAHACDSTAWEVVSAVCDGEDSETTLPVARAHTGYPKGELLERPVHVVT